MEDNLHFNDIGEYVQFLDRYRNIQVAAIDDEIKGFSNVISNWKNHISEDIAKHQHEETPDYNIFQIIKIPSLVKKEEEVHTPFLANLLNPKGTHGQGLLFYRRFIEACIRSEKRVLKFLPTDLSRLIVEPEKTIPEGRIDILISYRDGTKNFAICIENKIDAADQPEQLTRYHAYLSRTYTEFLLVYLTPGGHNPSPISISPSLFRELEEREQIISIAYKAEIATMLNGTLNVIPSDRLKGIIKQYLDIIK